MPFIWMRGESLERLPTQNSPIDLKKQEGARNNEPLPLPARPQLEVESRFAGWLSCILPENGRLPAGVGATGCVWRLELRGPDNTLRLRQVKVLGHGAGGGPDPEPRGDCRSLRIQQRNCEAETLRVFRLLTSQVGSTAPFSRPVPAPRLQRGLLRTVWAAKFRTLCASRRVLGRYF